MTRVALTASIAVLMLAGCAGEKFVGRPGMQVVEGTVLPAPGRRDLILQQRPYVVGPFDKIAVGVYGAPDLGGSVQVDASGKISLPLAGEIDASGLTPPELARAIEARLRGRYVRNPQVTVNAETTNQVLTVDGQVKKPGLYPVTGRMTLMRSIAMAEGASEYADTNYVVVFRRIDDKQMAALYDLRAIRQGIYDDPDVYANDIVYVGESAGKRAFQTLIQSTGLLTAPILAVVR